MVKTVGFIGLGQMGKWMALNLVKNNFDLTVYDINSKAMEFLTGQGAKPAKNPAQLAQHVDMIVLSLPNADIVSEVVYGNDGIVRGKKREQILLDCGTCGFLWTMAFAKKLEKEGIRFVDAPVTGMEQRAKDAALTIMFGGPGSMLKEIRPVLEAMGNNIVHMGDVGSGQLAKMINNIIFNSNIAALAEVLPMAVKLGLDAETIARVISNGSGQSFASDIFLPNILEDRFDKGYPLELAYKDMRHAMEVSDQKKIPLPMIRTAAETYQKALDSGWGQEDKGAMIKVFESALGVKFRKKV
ncbi:MAG: NAD(P)-dependent oxidoreductase [Desulfobacterales bacterium]|jgi:3-hydroxyisobutyrate dehydrogenase-like beta-hydroxyacid dehydrogenase